MEYYGLTGAYTFIRVCEQEMSTIAEIGVCELLGCTNSVFKCGVQCSQRGHYTS